MNPVRASLESAGIPLSLAQPKNSQPPPFRIRENLVLLNAIKDSPQTLCTASDWLHYIQQKPKNICWQQLKKLLENWQIETDNVQTSKQYLLEYLYESLAEQRRDSRLGNGGFLSTIHSVKGMEFSHVFILDGGWSIPAMEEQRRLLYVAMTRAKETLCLLKRQKLQNPYLEKLEGDFLLSRKSAAIAIPSVPIKNQQYTILGLADFDLGYAGGYAEQALIHQVLASLEIGSEVSIQNINSKIVVQKGKQIVAVLSQKSQQHWQQQYTQIQSAQIIAMITRYKTDSAEQYQSRCKVEQWEVPMIEVILIGRSDL